MSASSEKDLGIAGIDDIKLLDTNRSPVFSGRQRVIGRRVAVKILNPHNDPLLPRRFDRRRKEFSRFTSSSHVVPLYDSGETAEGKPYIVMPYFKIGSLQDQINHGKMPWHLASRIIQKAAESVAVAHAGEISLGDIKPSSILLSDSETPRLAVYGMATRRFDDGGPSFVAPEVTRDSEATPAGDVYSLALTLGTLITGEAPTATTSRDDFLNNLHEHLPGEIFDIVDHGTSTNLANRYGSAKHLATGLLRAINAASSPERGATKAPEPYAKPANAFSDEVGPISVDELLGPISLADSASGRSYDEELGDNPRVNTPKAIPNSARSLVHLDSEANSQAMSQFRTTAEIAQETTISAASTGDTSTEEPAIASATELGSKISLSEDSIGGPGGPHQQPFQDNRTQQVDITSLDAPATSSAPNPSVPQFGETHVFNPTEGPWAAGESDEPRFRTEDPQYRAENTASRVTPGVSPDSFNDRQRRPAESRRHSPHRATSDGLWLSIRDSWQSNRRWFTIALGAGVLAASSLIILGLLRNDASDSNTTGADLPPLTSPSDQSSTPEFVPPAAAPTESTEQDPAAPVEKKSSGEKPKPKATPAPTTPKATPTTAKPTTVAPSTAAPTTLAPTTLAPPTTVAPEPEPNVEAEE